MKRLAPLLALLAACASIGDRIHESLSQRGLGDDALRVIDNVLRHEAPPPPHAPAMVRELLERPLDAQDAAAIFRRAVPASLIEIDDAPPAAPSPFADLLRKYILELAQAQRLLRGATGKAAIDEDAIIRRLDEGLVSADQLLRVAAAVDPAMLERANALFVAATLRFAREARAATGFPREAMRFDSPIGIVSIGSRGNDRHGPHAALIVDPGGDDFYERSPAGAGRVSIIIDLQGNDRYEGSDVVVRGLSALVDFAGDDHYEMRGPGLAAAVGGVSLLVDFSGNDSYSAGIFGEGAAAFGLGALIDLQGNDRYALQAWGQGFGAAGGVGLLWDRAGEDAYAVAGEADPFERGAALSGAQGAAFGFRTMLGGGIGILRDERGDDAYEAEMFAQGIGYYYGIGLLWDGGGDDRYRAVRYAQGSGAHEALGVLRDESGNDRYALSFGVGQGMGLDLALGVLFDGGGDDGYRAGLLAQGTATANGIGLLADRGGSDRFRMDKDARAWGRAEWAGGLPSVGLFVYEPAGASFVKPPPGKPAAAETCGTKPALRLREAVATLRRDHFDAVLALGEQLRCAASEDATEIWQDIETILAEEPATPLGPWIARSLRKAPGRHAENILRLLEAHPSCAVRAAALAARPTEPAAQDALRSSCWRLQAAAREALARMGVAPPAGVSLPTFLRSAPAY